MRKEAKKKERITDQELRDIIRSIDWGFELNKRQERRIRTFTELIQKDMERDFQVILHEVVGLPDSQTQNRFSPESQNPLCCRLIPNERRRALLKSLRKNVSKAISRNYSETSPSPSPDKNRSTAKETPEDQDAEKHHRQKPIEQQSHAPSPQRFEIRLSAHSCSSSGKGEPVSSDQEASLKHESSLRIALEQYIAYQHQPTYSPRLRSSKPYSYQNSPVDEEK